MKHFLSFTCAGLVACAALADERPNVLVILADDLGYSDLGCYGGEIQTPNLDALASRGLRFTQAYNASRCCPTRASLLTGQYPHSVGLIKNGKSLSKDVPTMAEILKENGYRTAMVGKWHLTQALALAGDNAHGPEHLSILNNQTRVKLFGEKETYPVTRGFEKHYGVIWGIVNYFHPFALVDGFEPVYDLPEDYYITDALNQKASEYITEFSKSDEPFFLYLAHTAPHWPLQARKEDRAKYKGVYDAGYEALRESRYNRQIEMNLLDKSKNPLPPLDHTQKQGTDWAGLSADEKALLCAKFETHAAMVDRMDQGLGDVFETLEKTGELDNTLIFFLSDNGASPESSRKPGYDRPSETPDGRTIRFTGKIPTEEMGNDDTWAGLGPEWANAANTPLRYWKKESYNGGCQTPFIVHWPKGLKTEAGSITDAFCHVTDIQATVLAATGVSYPQEFKGKALKTPPGKSLLPIFNGAESAGHEYVFFEHLGGAAARLGDWKIVRKKPTEPWALYDFSKDRTETVNVANAHPERIAEMSAAWEKWWREIAPAGSN